MSCLADSVSANALQEKGTLNSNPQTKAQACLSSLTSSFLIVTLVQEAE